MNTEEEPTATIKFKKKIDQGLLKRYKDILTSHFLTNRSQNKPYVRQNNQKRILAVYGEAEKKYIEGGLAKYGIPGEVIHRDDPKEIKQKEPAISPELEARLFTPISPELERKLEIVVEKTNEEMQPIKKRKDHVRVSTPKLVGKILEILVYMKPDKLWREDIGELLKPEGYGICKMNLDKTLAAMYRHNAVQVEFVKTKTKGRPKMRYYV
ncbi:MAG: hypothetical protein AABW88_00350 [Nanoarchaeota archaeon]